VAGIRIIRAPDQKGLGALPARPLYNLVGTECLGFLNRPEEYPEIFA